MSRRAVTFASNGPESAGVLRYAHADAARLSSVLASPRCNFSVQHLQPGMSPSEIEHAVNQAAQACGEEDTFVVYFSGHGFVNRGSLLLMLDQTSHDRLLTSALHVDSLVRSMRFCNARHKLLILDCCHAGMVLAGSNFKDQVQVDMTKMVSREDAEAASFVALLASDRLERAREFDDLGGSFLTSTICDALEGETMAGDVDGDGAIDLRDLQEWLTFQARERNRDEKEAVPVPFVYGRARGRLFITRDPLDWPIVEFEGANGHKFVPLRLLGEGGKTIWLIGTTPVTNAQFQAYANEDGRCCRITGSSYSRDDQGRWKEGFAPWDDPEFNGPDQPVVCVSLGQAREYAHWLRYRFPEHFKAVVTPPDVWDMAAFGQPYPSFDKRLWLREDIHHKAAAPAPTTDMSRRPNRFGARDLFGNVWEWTSTNFEAQSTIALGVDAGGNWRERNQEIRGGSFLDDLAITRPMLAVGVLEDGIYTAHNDLGFRLAAEVPLSLMPADIQIRAQSAQRRRVHRDRDGGARVPATA